MKGSPDLYQLPMELSYMKLHRQEEKFSDLYQLPMELSYMDKRHMGRTTSKNRNRAAAFLIYGILIVNPQRICHIWNSMAGRSSCLRSMEGRPAV